jgi:hypothetical protein
MRKRIPKFENEEEERKFWLTHDSTEYVDWKKAKRATLLDLADFENVKHQVGSCGLWCGSCVVGNGVLKLLTKKYEELTEAYGLREWGPKDFDYAEFAKGLRSIRAMPSCSGCRKGGGRKDCEIRACASAKGLRECSECGAGDECPHRKVLDHMRAGGAAAGILVRIGTPAGEDPVEEWVKQAASRWPTSILFEDDG